MIMNVEEHVDVADPQELINRLKLFLQSQGWTINSHREGEKWAYNSGSGDYQWTTQLPTEDQEYYLEFQSNGYGNQILHYRFRVWGSLPNRHYLYGNMGWGNTSERNAIAGHPSTYFYGDELGGWAYRPFSYSASIDGMQTFVSNTNLPRVWFIGHQQKYCCVVQQLDAQKVHFMHFGTMEMHDFNSDYGGFLYNFGNIDWKTQTPNVTSFDAPNFTSFASYAGAYSGADRQYLNNAQSIHMANNGVNSEIPSQTAFNTMARWGCMKNGFSEFRPLWRPYHYVKDPADGIWFYSGRAPYYRLSAKDIRIGEKIKVSTEEYIAFPNFQVDASQCGVAFRTV